MIVPSNPHKKVKENPWGRYEQFLYSELGTLKLVYIKEGESISTQKHATRDEFWKVLKGEFEIIWNDKVIIVKEGDEIFIPKHTIHGAKSLKDEGLLLAISYGYFDPKDKDRIDDKYGRHKD
jgi:mannose-6-phosphate isomerase-like protein (cupin superfamily)